MTSVKSEIFRQMKKIIAIIVLMTFNQIYGQIGNDSIATKSKFISFFLISDSCNNLSDWHEKKDCSQKEIVSRFNKKIFGTNSTIIEKLSPKSYQIIFSFVMDEEGTISDIKIQTENATLKNELKKILELESMFSDFRLIDELGQIKKGTFRFPLRIRIE